MECSFHKRRKELRYGYLKSTVARLGREEAKIGWWTAAVAINPFDSDEVSYGTGATLFSTKNMTDLGSGTPVTIEFDAYGIEETAVFNMISPPTDGSTPQLYSIMGDLTGFSHMDVTECPDDAHFMKNGLPDSLDCAWQNPNIAAYTSDSTKCLNYTTDGGATWNTIKALPEKANGGKVAVAADGSAIIWRPSTLSGKPYITPISVKHGISAKVSDMEQLSLPTE